MIEEKKIAMVLFFVLMALAAHSTNDRARISAWFAESGKKQTLAGIAIALWISITIAVLIQPIMMAIVKYFH